MKYPQVVSMPSAVSDWLEEQLEARGIDSVVYTRYILSLLHRDSADLICPDQDSCFTHSCKEVRRSGASRKRLRRTSDWWTYDQADVDQLKRTAAVECLKSASDQKCGIESLVDELCEKLKEINNDSNANTETACTITNNTYSNDTSPQELADQYYAAFPPLNRNKSASSPGVITLIPKWIASPKKKPLRKHNRTASCDDKFHCKVGKPRLNNKKTAGWYSTRFCGENDWLNCGVNNVKTKRNQKNTMSDFKAVEKPNGETNNVEHLLGKGLLDDSPVQEDPVALMNTANMRDTGEKSVFACGTSYPNSIWADVPLQTPLNFFIPKQLGSIIPNFREDFDSNGWPADEASENNETNDGFPRVSWTPYAGGRWSNAESTQQLPFRNLLSESYNTLNHHRESSAFTEVLSRAPGYGRPISAITASAKNEQEDTFSAVAAEGIAIWNAASGNADAEMDNKEDLLTSARTHFKPINEKAEARGPEYPDGTSFVIPSTLDQVNYQRSESGTMFLESDLGAIQKYQEYSRGMLHRPDTFSLKFNVRENDKACQTDFEDTDYNDEVASVFTKNDQPSNDSFYNAPFAHAFVMDLSNKIWMDDSLITNNDSSNSETKRCRRCNGEPFACLGVVSLDMLPDDESIWNPWKTNGVCTSCLESAATQSQNQQLRAKLQEELSRDSEEMSSAMGLGLLSNTELSRDRKRGIWNALEGGSSDGAWSFASRLREDRVIQMSTLPTLRSVTL